MRSNFILFKNRVSSGFLPVLEVRSENRINDAVENNLNAGISRGHCRNQFRANRGCDQAERFGSIRVHVRDCISFRFFYLFFFISVGGLSCRRGVRPIWFCLCDESGDSHWPGCQSASMAPLIHSRFILPPQMTYLFRHWLPIESQYLTAHYALTTRADNLNAHY